MANAVDKEQIEMLKTWWNDYGKSILIAVVVGLVIGFGWRYWSRHKVVEQQNASGVYSQMESALLAKDEKVLTRLAVIMQGKYKGTAYADMGTLLAAKQEVDKGDLDKALVNFNWVMKNGSQNEFKALARLSAARVLLAKKQPQKALDLLKTTSYKPFQPLNERVKGDIYFSMGHKALAKQAYHKAQSGLSDMHIEDPYLSLLINQTE